MMQQWYGWGPGMLRRMAVIEEKLERLLQASGLAGPPEVQPRQPLAEEGAAPAAWDAAPWYSVRSQWWSGHSEGEAEALRSQASTWTPQR